MFLSETFRAGGLGGFLYNNNKLIKNPAVARTSAGAAAVRRPEHSPSRESGRSGLREKISGEPKLSYSIL